MYLYTRTPPASLCNKGRQILWLKTIDAKLITFCTLPFFGNFGSELCSMCTVNCGLGFLFLSIKNTMLISYVPS